MYVSVPSLVVDICAVVLALLLVRQLQESSTSSSPLPPGPKSWPIIGNLLDWPRSKEWETFEQWKHQYGTHHIYYLQSLPGLTDLGD